jgi:hypothetical protein
MKVKITRRHINKARPRNPDYCPIALALKELGYKTAWVDHMFAHINKEELPLPKEAAAFAISFDGDYPVEPMEFEL